jgi:hypothetical protein
MAFFTSLVAVWPPKMELAQFCRRLIEFVVSRSNASAGNHKSDLNGNVHDRTLAALQADGEIHAILIKSSHAPSR